MRKLLVGLVCLTLVPIAAVSASADPVHRADATPSGPGVPSPDGPAGAPADDLPNPLEEKRRELRQAGLDAVLQGEALPVRRGASTVVKVASDVEPAGSVGVGPAAGGRWRRGRAERGGRDQYVELSREATDRVFAVLVEFGDERHPDYPDQDTDPDWPGPATFDGPLHNQIPEPDRSVDNSTVWQPDYDRGHFEGMYFGTDRESVKTYYETQSSGRYSIEGTVTDWVKVPYNEARYGRSNGYPCADVVCDNTWALIADAVNAWEAEQRAAGRTEAEIAAELATFDQWDRYDHNGNGNFDEPDGYIDHFQIVHAGGDQADADPHQGEDAIWSHRWYAYVTDAGITGPESNPLGGTEIGGSDIWVGDYTIQPENGGLSVFAHEYGHDLGLPDDYDTSGGGDNSVEYWSLMAQSRLNGEGEPLGTRPGDLGAWNKLKLGWLDYEIVAAGQRRVVRLGPSEYNNRRAQALVVTLPDKTVTREYGAPYAGEAMWWSDSGDDLSNTLTREVDLTGASSAALDLQARFEIEAEYDYLYAQASTDGGATWTSLDGTVGGEPFVRDGSDSPAISGSSGADWVDVHVPLDAYAGAPFLFRFLYRTDGGVAPVGFFADEITFVADGAPVVADGAESEDHGWTADGFRVTTGTETEDYPNYYLAASRSYRSYDRYLATGPYNFGFPDRPNWVEHYAYQTGLLLTYLDGSQADNNTNVHPGEGRNLVIDSRPLPINNMCGETWRTRIQVYDAPFTRRRADSMTLHCEGTPSYVRGQRGNPVFDDRWQWWYPEQPNHGVKVPVNGVRIEVLRERDAVTTVRVSSTLR